MKLSQIKQAQAKKAVANLSVEESYWPVGIEDEETASVLGIDSSLPIFTNAKDELNVIKRNNPGLYRKIVTMA